MKTVRLYSIILAVTVAGCDKPPPPPPTTQPQGHVQQEDAAAALQKGTSAPSSSTNLKDSLSAVANTTFEPGFANKIPSDLNAKAKELHEEGTKLFFELNQPADGILKLQEALKIDPRIPPAYNTIKVYYAYTKKSPDIAIEFLLEGIKHCPKASRLRSDLGEVYLLTKQYAKAAEHYQAAVELGVEPEAMASTLNSVGLSFAKLGSRKDAISYFLRSINADGNYLKARQNLVVAYAESGQESAARAQAQKLAEADPNGEFGAWARNALQMLK